MWFFGDNLPFFYIIIYFCGRDGITNSRKQMVIIWRRIIWYQRMTGVKSEKSKQNISRERTILHVARRMFQWCQDDLWTYLEVIMNLLTSIVPRYAKNCCSFFRWSMVGTYCCHQHPRIFMTTITWHRKSQMKFPPHRGRLSPWRCWNFLSTMRSVMVMQFNFVSVNIKIYIVWWSHEIKVGG